MMKVRVLCGARNIILWCKWITHKIANFETVGSNPIRITKNFKKYKYMKQYPTIEYWNKGIFGEYVYAFDKYDGSNIRVEWDKRTAKKSNFTGGFRKFGSRTQMINKTTQFLGDSVDIFLDKYSDALNEVFLENRYFRNIDQVTIFCEYYGENSFAGAHKPEDKKDVIMFDIQLYKKGFIKPKDFIELFGHLHIPDLVYQGNYNKELIYNIRNRTDLKEGVVCKGVRKTKGQDIVWMVKIKTNEWLEKLKRRYGEKELLKEINNDLTLDI